MAARIKPMKRMFLAPKFFVPLALLLWMLVSFSFMLLVPPAGAQSSTCPSTVDPFRKVYSPSRLQLINKCQQASGTVTYVERWFDFDYDVYVRLDDSSKNLVTQTDINNLRKWSQARQNGGADMLWEIVPYDQGSCSSNKLPKPTVGEHIQGIGGYVIDKDYNYKELHRLYQEKDLGSGQTCSAW